MGGGLAIVYDFLNHRYTIDTNFNDRPTGSDTAFLGFFDSAALDYNVTSNSFTSFVISDRGTGNNSVFWQDGGLGRIPALGYSGNLNGTRLVDNNLFFDGGFNLPLFFFDPAPVPAPPALLLFGIGAGALAWRRRSTVRKLSA
nr:hypothetical protein [uncultured bacterium]